MYERSRGHRRRAIADARSQIEALFHRHAAGVGGYVIARTGDRDMAETITAEVFANVVRKFHQCRGSPAAWLWAIVRNELARHLRDEHARRDRALLDDASRESLVDGSHSPQRILGERESHDRLHEALKQLDPEQHTIVYMKFFQDLPNTDIAEAIGVTANHVGVKVHRTLRRLRELMRDDADEGAQPPATPSPMARLGEPSG